MPRKRANGEGAIVRIKAPGRKPYAAVVTVGWSLDGKPIRKARSADSMKAAKVLLDEMRQARDTHRPLPDDKMTVGKWLRSWYDSGDVRPNTIAQRRKVAQWALPELGQIPVQKLRSTHVEAFLSGLRDRGYSHNSIAGAKSVLGSALKDAAREGYVTTNAAQLARLPKVSRTKLQAPTTEDVRAVLAALEGHRLRPLFVLLAGTGLRIGEALGLRWEDLDATPHGTRRDRALRADQLAQEGRADEVVVPPGVDRGDGPVGVRGVSGDVAGVTLTVRYQLAQVQGEWVLAPPKTEGRTLHLGPSVVAALREQKARQAADQLRAGRDWAERGLVFTRENGEPLARSTVKLTLDTACERAGVRHMVVHDLRRWTATELEERLGRDAGQLVLGHTTPQMTERYVSTRDSLLRRAADELSEAIG